MKKQLSYLLTLFVFVFTGIMAVSAASATVSKGSLSTGGVFDFNYSGVPENCKLDYDSSLISMTNTNGNLSGQILKSGNGKITFQVNKISLQEDKSVSIKIVKDDVGSEEITRANITIKANQVTTKPTTQKQDQPVTTNPPTTQAPKSGNANLKSLEVLGSDGSEVTLSPIFTSNIYEYDASVPGRVKMISINAIMEDEKANMVISNNANEELISGENNKITITVTAEDGTKKAYVINIRRDSLTSDATLSSLKIEEVPNFELEPDVFKYSIKIGSKVKALNLDYVTNDQNSLVTITGNENLKDDSKVKILVTAEDGTKKEYVLTIIKEKTTTKRATSNTPAEKNPIIIMVLSIIAFGLVGSIIYTIKK